MNNWTKTTVELIISARKIARVAAKVDIYKIFVKSLDVNHKNSTNNYSSNQKLIFKLRLANQLRVLRKNNKI